MNTTATFLDELIGVAKTLHQVGSLPAASLRAIARHLDGNNIEFSLETGSGASTLLFSHLSRNHTVFSLDYTGSVSNTKVSPLLNRSTTTFIEGPSQITLPAYKFQHQLQAVLLDGPHGFPLPALEYYYVYPHLAEGALFMIDNIEIPSVHDFFRFLKAEPMFRLIEIVECTAFFRRTSVPVFDPLGDGWWDQEYNKRVLFRFVWRQKVRKAIPLPIRRTIRKILPKG